MRQDDTPTQQGSQKTRSMFEWAEASKGTAKMQGVRTGSHAVGDWSEDLWKAWRAKLRNVLQKTRERRGVACVEAWLGTWHHVDSWTSTVVQVRGVSMMEEHEGWWMWGQQRWAAQESPAGCGCTRGVLCNKEQDYEPNLKLCRVIPQQINEIRDNVTDLITI